MILTWPQWRNALLNPTYRSLRRHGVAGLSDHELGVYAMNAAAASVGKWGSISDHYYQSAAMLVVGVACRALGSIVLTGIHDGHGQEWTAEVSRIGDVPVPVIKQIAAVPSGRSQRTSFWRRFRKAVHNNPLNPYLYVSNLRHARRTWPTVAALHELGGMSFQDIGRAVRPVAAMLDRGEDHPSLSSSVAVAFAVSLLIVVRRFKSMNAVNGVLRFTDFHQDGHDQGDWSLHLSQAGAEAAGRCHSDRAAADQFLEDAAGAAALLDVIEGRDQSLITALNATYDLSGSAPALTQVQATLERPSSGENVSC